MSQHPEQRPRFELVVDLPPDQVSARLTEGLKSDACPCVGSVSRQHAWIHVRPEDRHFWSPTLDLQVDAAPQGSLLRGRFGPHPEVWTLFVFIYAALGVTAVIAGTYGIAQLALDRSPWALALTVAATALIGFVYGAAFIGQGLGSEQIVQIRLFLDRTVGPADPPSPEGEAPPEALG